MGDVVQVLEENTSSQLPAALQVAEMPREGGGNTSYSMGRGFLTCPSWKMLPRVKLG